MRNLIVIIIVSLFLLSCENKEQSKEQQEPIKKEKMFMQEIKSPTKMNSSVPNFFINEKEEVFLTWTQSDDNKVSTLYFSNLKDGSWQKATKIDKGNNWIVNWADFSSLTQFGDSSLVVNYLVESNPETYAYDVNLIISNDRGKTWGTPFTPHLDKTQTEHGFVSLVPYKNETFMAIWLDGRKYETGEDEMTLRAAIINKKGVIEQEFVLDERVCDCCATDAIRTDKGISVIYRDRDENEVRDMSIVNFEDEKWSNPQLVANDNWKIAGCPVNGPAIDVQAENTVIAWFTQAGDDAKVKFSFSKNSLPFSIPITINTQEPIGRVDVCLIDENTAAISWIEGNDKTSYLKVRTVKTDGTGVLGEPIVISKMDASRSSGFPKMVKKDNQLLFTWTKTGKETSVKTVLVNLLIFEEEI